MSTKKETKKGDKKSPKKPERKIVLIHAKHEFTPDEIKELALNAGRQQREITSLEANLSSIKKDYSSKLEAAAVLLTRCLERVQEGFEMREIEAVCEFDDKNKKKHFFVRDTKKPSEKGALIRSEDYTPADLERDLPFPTGAGVKAEQPNLNPVLTSEEAAQIGEQELGAAVVTDEPGED